jgi:hypothetical protein
VLTWPLPAISCLPAGFLLSARCEGILEVVWVCNPPWHPGSPVCRIIDHRRTPLALVRRVGLHRTDPSPAPRSLGTLGVRDGRRNPVAIFLVIPLLGSLHIWIGDSQRLVSQPALGLNSILVRDRARCVLIPVFTVGSGILASPTKSDGFLSSGSSISLGGLTAGSKFSRRLALMLDSLLTRISNVLLGLYNGQNVIRRM